ncbi:hypothetical protein [Peredibacter starrii]|uniref:Uncharacterized protein n=1 Tax=Peredibacter starrii TaxID=28202 RepID=A0AAX4HRR7_9BACT|nr:hypothetical protein [Peredibacter starrii]WPU65892.1 hypothetical protein SOO65_03955 [Peredibacter starrii]
MENIKISDSEGSSGSLCLPKIQNRFLDRRTLPYATKNKLKNYGSDLLKQAYEEVCLLLNKTHKKQVTVTQFEKLLLKEIKLHTKLEVHQSFWIGNMNIDLFFPSIKGSCLQTKDSGFQFNGAAFNGVGIEVNGEIHEQYVSMLKDNFKYAVLEDMGIMIFAIDNEDINSVSVQNIIKDLCNFKKVDSRSKQRLLDRIYLQTIVAHRKLIFENRLTLPMTILKALGYEE